MNRSARGWSVKRFERSNGLDTALYTTYLYLLYDGCFQRCLSRCYSSQEWSSTRNISPSMFICWPTLPASSRHGERYAQNWGFLNGFDQFMSNDVRGIGTYRVVEGMWVDYYVSCTKFQTVPPVSILFTWLYIWSLDMGFDAMYWLVFVTMIITNDCSLIRVLGLARQLLPYETLCYQQSELNLCWRVLSSRLTYLKKRSYSRM